jgi:hypothetical protein
LLNRVAVETDDGLEQRRAEHRGAELLLAGDDLQQDAAREVLAALVVDDLDALTSGDQPAQVLERHVTAVVRVVQSPVGVFAYQAFFGHVKQCLQRGRELGRQCTLPDSSPSVCSAQ